MEARQTRVALRLPSLAGHSEMGTMWKELGDGKRQKINGAFGAAQPLAEPHLHSTVVERLIKPGDPLGVGTWPAMTRSDDGGRYCKKPRQTKSKRRGQGVMVEAEPGFLIRRFGAHPRITAVWRHAQRVPVIRGGHAALWGERSRSETETETERFGSE